MIKLIDYLIFRFSSRPVKLAMSILVKDEIDIIELNIRYHYLVGVDAFFIMDNGSTDGTYEKLMELKKLYPIYLYQNAKDGYLQDRYMTFLAKEALKKGYDWSINNDADEFWFPQSGSLKTELNGIDTSVRVRRVNSLPIKGLHWLKSPYITRNTIAFDLKSEADPTKFNLMFNNVMHKVMTNLHGLVAISGGNHGARHIWDKLKGRRFSRYSNDITIFHFYLRGIETLEKKVRDFSQNLDKPKGQQTRFWYRVNQNQGLKLGFENLLLKEECIDCYESLGVLEKDDRLLNFLLKNRLIKE